MQHSGRSSARDKRCAETEIKTEKSLGQWLQEAPTAGEEKGIIELRRSVAGWYEPGKDHMSGVLDGRLLVAYRFQFTQLCS